MKENRIYKIAINTRLLLKNKLEGIGWFEFHILNHWVKKYPQHQFYFLFDRAYDSSFIFGSNVTPVIVNPPARHPFLWYLWYEWAVPRALNKINPDIFLSFDTYTSVRWNGKKITGIHDIAFALFDGHVYPIAQKFLRYFTPKYIKTSDKIITVSQATKNDLIREYKTEYNKIVVANNAPADLYKPFNEIEKSEFKNTYIAGKDYFLFVGSIHPRKNVLKLLQGFEMYKSNHPSKVKLVIIGRLSWKYDDIVSYHYRMTHKNDVEFINHSSPELISKYMASAMALVMVSVYEGFGVPIVEAMACKTPIICSNVSSLPEVAGNAAILVSPYSEKEISDAFFRISNDETLRNELILNGQIQVQKYTWSKSADIVWTEVEKCINNES